MATSVWSFGTGQATAVPADEHGRFSSADAYVILVEEEVKRLYLWAGDDSPKDARTAAAQHAGELMKSVEASYLRQQQGQETPEFKQLFATFEVTPAAAAAAEASADGAAEEEEDVEDPEGESQEASAGGAGKKKRKNKKKKKQGQSQQQEVPVASEDADPAAVAEVEAPAAAAEPAAETVEQPAAAEPAPEPAAAPAEEAPAAEQPAEEAPAAEEPAAEAQAPASAVKAQLQSPAPASTPVPAAAVASPAAAKSEAPAVTAVAAAASPAASAKSPTTVADPTPAKEDSPKVGAVETTGSPGVAKAKEQLMSRLSGTFSDPLAQKQKSKEGTAVAKSSATYLADSAKAWGGVGTAAVATVEVKILPGQQTFDYEALKGMRAESGIDMTCKESYLQDAEFEKVFGKDRTAFKALPAWRQQLLKKQVGLW